MLVIFSGRLHSWRFNLSTPAFARGRSLWAGLAVGCVLLAAGCAWIPPGGKRAEFMPAPDMAHGLSEAREKEPLTPRRAWPEDRRWRQFDSPELNRLMAVALKDNPGLKAAAARLRQAQAMARVEGARLLPFLDADVEFANERISENGVFAALNREEAAGANVIFASINPVSLRYEFDFWGKNRAALEAALGEAEATAAEQAEVRLQLTTAIARAYFRGAALKRQLDLAREMVELRHELLELADTRFESGLTSASSVKRANIALETAQKREAGTEDQLDVQRNLLARLMGTSPDETRQLFANPVTIPERIPLPTRLPIGLLAHRPDLAAALHRTEAAAHRIKEAKARFLPTVDLTAFVGVNALRLTTKGASSLANVLFSGSSFAYGIAPGLRLPWFEGGRLRGELSAQRAEYDGAVELYNDTLVQAIQEVADSLSSWRETRNILEAHLRLLVSQREDLDLAQTRLQAGLDDRRTVLQSRHAVLNQEYVLKSLETNQLVAMTDLIEALGGGYTNNADITRPQSIAD
ncbi:efflux transporter outer membrane subunit [Methylocaldum sp. 14B]|uniref:efflux transporter outer membrane subunit n=1 Tax=Methylocaldum sp. 14B TaxID=1912213 RepID=UPI00098ADAE0|nr:efflux transporter outer membrane subunit [Methylocaldum sp. 14B]